MAGITWAEVEKQHSHLQTLRAREESIWRELAVALEESGNDFNVRSDRRRPQVESMDSTALYAKDDFVGGMFTEAVNPAGRWFDYTLEDKDLAKWGPVKKYLWDRASAVLSSLDPGVATFYVEATPWFSDMASYGSGHLATEEDMGRGRIIDRSLPIAEILKDVDADGQLIRLHREFMLNATQAGLKWGARAPTMSDNQESLFVHCIYENPEYQPSVRLGLRAFPWLSTYVSPDHRDFSVIRGYYEMPVHAVEWKRRSGRTWATGPGHKARADINMLEEMNRSMITSLQFEAEPMFLVHNEDVMTVADIVPNTVIPGGVNEQGKPLAMPLQRGENLRFPTAEVAAIRQAIRDGFHFGMLQLVNRPQMTAAEFLGWKEEKLRLLAPHLVCLQRGLSSFVIRRDAILGRAGALPPAPPELQGRSIKLAFMSPFAQVQKATQARSAQQLAAAVQNLLPLSPSAGDNLNIDGIVRSIHDGLSGDPALINDEKTVETIRKQRMMMQAQQLELEQAAEKAGIVADVAHASQAMTSAGSRAATRRQAA